MKTNQTNFVAVLKKAQSEYIANCEKRNKPVKLNKSGLQPDIANAIDNASTLTDGQIDTLASLNLGDAMLQGLKKANVKTCKRIIQVLQVITGGDAAKHLKGSARTLFLSVGSIIVAKASTRDGLVFGVTGKGNEHSSDGINVTVARNLQRMGVTSPASFATQSSVCFAQGAMGDLLGVGRTGGKGALPIINEESPVTSAIIQRIAALTQIEMQAIAGDAESASE